jgi:hypothetical protein
MIVENYRSYIAGRWLLVSSPFGDLEGLRLRHAVGLSDEFVLSGCVTIRTLRQHDCAPGQGKKVAVEVRSSITHTTTPMKVYEWLQWGARSAKGGVIKQRLRGLL